MASPATATVTPSPTEVPSTAALTLADRIVLLEAGAVALDIAVELPRPRRRGSAEFAALEERILGRLLQNPVSPDQTGAAA